MRKTILWIINNTVAWGLSWMLALLALPMILNVLPSVVKSLETPVLLSIFSITIIPAIIISISQILFLRMGTGQSILWILATIAGMSLALLSAMIAMLLAFAAGVIPRQLPVLVGNFLCYVIIYVAGGIGGFVSGPLMWLASGRRFFWRWLLGSVLAWAGSIGLMISAIPMIQYPGLLFGKRNILSILNSFLSQYSLYLSEVVTALVVGLFAGVIYGGILLWSVSSLLSLNERAVPKSLLIDRIF